MQEGEPDIWLWEVWASLDAFINILMGYDDDCKSFSSKNKTINTSSAFVMSKIKIMVIYLQDTECVKQIIINVDSSDGFANISSRKLIVFKRMTNR